MLLKTLLNRVHPVKGFVYDSDRLIADPASASDVRNEETVRPHLRHTTGAVVPVRAAVADPRVPDLCPASDRLSRLRRQGRMVAVVRPREQAADDAGDDGDLTALGYTEIGILLRHLGSQLNLIDGGFGAGTSWDQMLHLEVV